MIHRGWRQEERLHKHRDTTQDAGHSVNALPAITERILKGGTLRNQRVYMGGIAFILPVLQRLVEGSDILSTKALHNKYHHILRGKRHAVVGHMNR